MAGRNDPAGGAGAPGDAGRRRTTLGGQSSGGASHVAATGRRSAPQSGHPRRREGEDRQEHRPGSRVSHSRNCDVLIELG